MGNGFDDLYLILLFHVSRVLKKAINPFQHIVAFHIETVQPSVAFHIETSHLICIANQMTGFFMNCSTGRNWVKEYHTVTRVLVRE